MNNAPLAPAGKEDLLELEGTVEHIVYQNESTGYTVCDLAVSENELVTLVGVLPFLAAGESIRALGRWEIHASFGRQFKAEYYEKQLPADESAMLKYLSSGAVKGIGPVLARRIVGRFGTEAFDVIENHPEWLADIQGITKKTAQRLSERFRESAGMRSVMMFCRDFFSPATAVKVYQKWGSGALERIRSDPYSLCESIQGVGFETADRIAASVGTEKDAPERLRAGIVWFLSFNAAQNGHTFLPLDRLMPAAAQYLSVEEEKLKPAAAELIRTGRLVPVTYGGREVLYLKEYFEAERYAAAKIDQLDRLCERISWENTDRFLQQIEAEFDITYAALQKKAILSAVNNGVMLLTGGPGTGKSTVIRAVIAVFERMGLPIALAAPTGRAAKRMSEATSREAKTIHRLLEMDYSDEADPKFRRGEYNLLDESVIVIDEASMVDILLFASLLKAIKPGAHLILIGDADQLPSVGAGYVLNDLLACDRLASVRLTEIFRQAGSSLIVRNAHAINNGEYPDLTVRDNDFFFIPRESGRSAAQTVAELCASRLPRRYGAEAARGIQVITPSHKGPVGTDYLNTLLQEALNPPDEDKREKKLRERIFREGDKVMQVRNNYDILWEKNGAEGVGIFNGDIGTIIGISNSAETVTVSFDERVAVYDFTQLDELELAYAITIHKSQGSEYPIVVLPICGGPPRLLTRNLLYTAVTRAKDMVIVVGSAETMKAMVDNDRHVKRYTGLRFLLRAYGEDPN